MKIISITIKHVFDQDTQPEFATYTDKYPGADALKRGNAKDRKHGTEGSHREYRYLVNENDSVEGEREALNKGGMSRGLSEFYARRMMRHNMDMCDTWNNQRWYYIGVIVTAKIEYDSPFGPRTEEVEESLWGIEAGTHGLSCFGGVYDDPLLYCHSGRKQRYCENAESSYVTEIEMDLLRNVRAQVKGMLKNYPDIDVASAFNACEVEHIELS